MTSNSTQPSHPPLELSVVNIEHHFDIQPLLPTNITADSQQSFISFNQTDMIPSATINDSSVRNNVEPMNGLTIRPRTLPLHDTEAFARRQREQHRRLHEAHQHLQQERRRIKQEQRRIDQEREHLNDKRERERQRRDQLRRIQIEQRHRQRNGPPQNYPVRHRSSPRYDQRHFDMMNRHPSQESMDDHDEQLLEAYNYETTSSQARQEAWDQQHLREMQGLSEPQHSAVQQNSLEAYALVQDAQLQRDQLEQDMRIYEMHHEDNMQQCRRNEEQLMDKEEWEDIAFRLQQQR